MSNKLLDRRKRLVRVRQAQHAMAVAETLEAKEQVRALNDNAQRLAQVRAELFKTDSRQLGGNFAAYREMADRLERAGKQLEGAIYDANRKVEGKQGRQLEANRDKEIAQRLKDRTVAEVEEQREARIAAIPRARSLPLRGL